MADDGKGTRESGPSYESLDPREHIAAITVPVSETSEGEGTTPATEQPGEMQAPDSASPANVDLSSMTKTEIRAYVDGLTPEQAKEFLQRPDVAFGTAEVSRTKNELAEDRKKLETERNVWKEDLDRMRAQLEAPAQLPDPGPAPEPPEYMTPEMRVIYDRQVSTERMLQQLAAKQEQREQSGFLKSLYDGYDRGFQAIETDYPWAAKDLRSNPGPLIDYMKAEGIQNPMVAFRALYSDRIADQRAEEALKRQRAQLKTQEAVPDLTPTGSGATPPEAPIADPEERRRRGIAKVAKHFIPHFGE